MFRRGDDGCTFREIAVVGVVQRVLDVVTNQHLDSPRGVFGRLQGVGCDAFVADVLWIGNIVKIDLGVKVELVSLLRLGTGERRVGGREETEGLKAGRSPSTPSSARSHKDHGGQLFAIGLAGLSQLPRPRPKPAPRQALQGELVISRTTRGWLSREN